MTFRPSSRFPRIPQLAAATFTLAAFLPGLAAQPAPPPPAAPVAPAAIDSPLDALARGKFTGAVRYRYEVFEQDAAAHTSVASTVRLMLGYRTAEWRGLSLYGDVESIHSIGADRYRVPNVPGQNGTNTAFPAIADPLVTELNQLYLNYVESRTGATVRVGREAYFLNNGRFISFSGWRQDNQSIDLASFSVPAGPVTLSYGYLDKVHRVTGPEATDSPLAMDSHVFNAAYAKPGLVNASLYGLLLDYDVAAQAANDTATVGLRVNGPYKLSDTLSLLYTLDYARQTDRADNPNDVSLDYYTLELGLDYKGHKAFLGYTVLEGDGVSSIRTPLANPFNGWTELFLNTPATGLEAFYVTFTGPVPGVKGVTYTTTYYDYAATDTSARYGSELDAALEWKAAPIHKNLTLGWRFGQYYADALFSDSLRTSLYAAFTF